MTCGYSQSANRQSPFLVVHEAKSKAAISGGVSHRPYTHGHWYVPSTSLWSKLLRRANPDDLFQPAVRWAVALTPLLVWTALGITVHGGEGSLATLIGVTVEDTFEVH